MAWHGGAPLVRGVTTDCRPQCKGVGWLPLLGFVPKRPYIERLELSQEPIQHAGEAPFERSHAICCQREPIDVAEHVPETQELT